MQPVRIRSRRVRRRWLWAGGVALGLAGLAIYSLHTSAVRRLALGQIRNYLRNSQGLVVEAESLDYNLFSSEFELKQPSVKDPRSMDLPAPWAARRVVVSAPLWQVASGSFDGAKIRIEGLVLHWTVDAGGRSNWPSIRSSGGGVSGGPSVSVSGGDVRIEDRRTGVSLHLPVEQMSGRWNPGKNRYDITATGSGGKLNWKPAVFSLDRLDLKSSFANSGFTIESLRLAAGSSRADVSGSVNGSTGQVDATAALDIDLEQLSRMVPSGFPAQGRLKVDAGAKGPARSLMVKANLAAREVVVAGVRIGEPAADVNFDSSTGELRITGVSAGLFSGKLTGSGQIWTADNRRPSEFAVRLAGTDQTRIAAALGSASFPPGRVDVEAKASWPGLDWQHPRILADLRSGPAALSLTGARKTNSLDVSFQGSLGEGSDAQGTLTFDPTGRRLAHEVGLGDNTDEPSSIIDKAR